MRIIYGLIIFIGLFHLAFAGGYLIDNNRGVYPRDDKLTFNEYHELIKVYNYEIKKLGGEIKTRKGESVLEALNREILSRPVEKEEEMIRAYDGNFKAMPYKERRQYLINKSL